MQILFLLFFVLSLEAQSPAELVAKAVDHWRDSSSYTEASMRVVRPDWTREMKFKAWTKDRDKSLVKFTFPPKDNGSASLTNANNSWSFSPKIGKVVKIPPSMMSQSWMGSDFSYQDLSKADDILEYYDHMLLENQTIDGHQVYKIEAKPKPAAPVVWGKEVLLIRDDYIILRHDFYDQQGKLLKVMKASDFQVSEGKVYAKNLVIEKTEEPGSYTEVVNDLVRFKEKIEDSQFTVVALSNVD